MNDGYGPCEICHREKRGYNLSRGTFCFFCEEMLRLKEHTQIENSKGILRKEYYWLVNNMFYKKL